jgi:hypothetical protein
MSIYFPGAKNNAHLFSWCKLEGARTRCLGTAPRRQRPSMFLVPKRMAIYFLGTKNNVHLLSWCKLEKARTRCPGTAPRRQYPPLFLVRPSIFLVLKTCPSIFLLQTRGGTHPLSGNGAAQTMSVYFLRTKNNVHLLF